MVKKLFCLLILFVSHNALAITQECHPLLWPAANGLKYPPSTVISELQLYASTKLNHYPNPVETLNSAGVVQFNDQRLILSRQALKDADLAALFALTYQLTHKIEYFNKSRDILIAWAKKNHPTGNPIDETRLEGMLWAYDLISCDVSLEDKILILDWFNSIRIKKKAWIFGRITSINNHRIHQIKMLLLLDILLNRHSDLFLDIKSAQKYSKINLNPKTGVSIDYIERNALYYHNYVLQPWLEISLISQCCQQSVTKAFVFLSHQLIMNNIGHEFVHSESKIDELRDRGGFLYAKKDGIFAVEKSVPTIIAYYTFSKEKPPYKLWRIQHQAKLTPWLMFIKARRKLWTR